MKVLFRIDIKGLLNTQYLIAEQWLNIGAITYLSKTSDDNKCKIIWIGDLVLPEGFKSNDEFIDSLLYDFSPKKVITAGGVFYAIRIINEERKIEIYSNFLNIAPLYKAITPKGNVLISSDINAIIRELNSYSVSKRFIIEKLLLNYPYKNETIIEQIKMLSTNHYYSISANGIMEISIMDIEEMFSSDPMPLKKSMPMLSNLFLNRMKSYIPEEHFFLSFTGGFDGRTILGACRNFTNNFTCYSFGGRKSEDVSIPLEQSTTLGIKYQPFYLDNDNYLANALDNGLDLVRRTGCMSNFARAHYAFSCKNISNSSKYIITGNFGSETFRSAHASGVMISPLLCGLFSAKNKNDYWNSYVFKELAYIDVKKYNETILSIKEELFDTIPFESNLRKRNIIFSKYLYEEIFRKYFGAEIMFQSDFVFNRYPFLDFSFFTTVLRTKQSGIYANYFDNNPIHRVKGQVFYAEFLKRFAPDLFTMKTGKGYRPCDITSNFGKIALIKSFLAKKRKNNEFNNIDPFGVQANMINNENRFQKSVVNEKFFNNFKSMSKGNNYINYWSLNYLVNLLEE